MYETKPVNRDVLILAPNGGSIAKCLEIVGHEFRCSHRELISARRAQHIARPRMVGYWLAKESTTASLPQIGHAFGQRDHTTIMHGCRRVEELRQADPAFKLMTDRLLERAVLANDAHS